jgi:hypothetical protein
MVRSVGCGSLYRRPYRRVSYSGVSRTRATNRQEDDVAKKQTRARTKRVAKKKKASRQKTQAPRGGGLFRRMPRSAAASPAEAGPVVPGGAAPPVFPPEARIARTGGPVSIDISFGFAQHGSYTLQLFDPAGTQLIDSLAGVNTDGIADTFRLQPTPGALDRHLIQWSGAVDAFTNAPGQRFSVDVQVKQGGGVVPGGSHHKEGPLDVTQAFLGAVRLVAS